jgi:ubiquinone/menaquinone biosynthesis C-methylase UbiE
MNETRITAATYDQIAVEYAQRWLGRGALAEITARFVKLLPSGAVVLDIGCGPGLDSERLRRAGLQVYSFDRSWGMLLEARRHTGAPLAQADMRQLPLSSASCDALWVCASFLHIPKRDAKVVLREFRRVLRPNGLMYIGVKQGQGEKWVTHENGLARFFVFYSPNEFDQLLGGAGFSIHEGHIAPDSLGREPWINRIVGPHT